MKSKSKIWNQKFSKTKSAKFVKEVGLPRYDFYHYYHHQYYFIDDDNQDLIQDLNLDRDMNISSPNEFVMLQYIGASQISKNIAGR